MIGAAVLSFVLAAGGAAHGQNISAADLRSAADAIGAQIVSDAAPASTSAARVRLAFGLIGSPASAEGEARLLGDFLARRFNDDSRFEVLFSTVNRADFAVAGDLVDAADHWVATFRIIDLRTNRRHSLEPFYFEPPPVVVSTAAPPAGTAAAMPTVATSPPKSSHWLGGGAIVFDGIGWHLDYAYRDSSNKWQATLEGGGWSHADRAIRPNPVFGPFGHTAYPSDTSAFDTNFIQVRVERLLLIERIMLTAGAGIGRYEVTETEKTDFAGTSGDEPASTSTRSTHDYILPSAHLGVIWPMASWAELRASVLCLLQGPALGNGAYRIGGFGAELGLGVRLK